jgi:lipid-A-disaccharide synthase
MTESKDVLIIAGEKSGEEHCLSFFDDLAQKLPNHRFFGVGGDALQSRGMELLFHMNDFSSIGISNVIGKIPFYMKAMKKLLLEVEKRNVKTAILIDFQTFNLKLAKKLKKKGVNVLYYVAPQAWVWKAYRAEVLAETVHTLFCILPFEKKWFQERGVKQIVSIAHPLLINHQKDLESHQPKNADRFQDRVPRVLILPGSRNTELQYLLPPFEKAVHLLREEGIEIEVGILQADSVNSDFFKERTGFTQKVFQNDQMVEAMEWADMGLATSGTVTLATGLFGLPVVVGYRMSMLNEYIFSSIIKYDGPISLTNIVHEEYVYPEYTEYHADRYNFSKHLKDWIVNTNEYNKKCEKLEKTKELLSGEDIDVPGYMAQVIQGKVDARP